LRVLDCKVDGPKLKDAPTIDQFWCEDCQAHFKAVTTLLKKAGGQYTLAPRLVRGLDYYSRTVFELVTTALGAQDALAAGGRYDKLVKQLGGPDVPGIGFALGSERTLLALGAAGKKAENGSGFLVFVAAQGDEVSPEAFELLQDLRSQAALHDRKIF